MSNSTNVRSSIRREVTVWLNMAGAMDCPSTTLADVEAFIERLRANGGHDKTVVEFVPDLGGHIVSPRLSATVPLPEPTPPAA